MKRLAVIANRQKPGVDAALRVVHAWADRHRVSIETNLEREPDPQTSGPFSDNEVNGLRQRFEGSDMVLTLGGDGTLLYSAQVVAGLGIPVLSANLGSVGFHTQVEPSVLEQALERVLEKRYRLENRLLLKTQITGGEPAERIVLNDIVISKSAWGHMVHLRIQINDQPATDVSADGVLVASPTGSSAYNFAAGGPVLAPSLEAMVLNAICPHRMHFAPLVVGADAEVTIRFHPTKPLEEAQLLVDGQPWRLFTHTETLKISRAGMYLPLVVFDDDFYRKLREKLRWGGLF